ncbi:MAG: FAD-binding oxidoreductase, partial [Pseudomonadota bacterium]
FNTIGNLVADPRVGLLFLDFAGGGLLQITGRATIDWDSPAVAEHAGARRLVIIDIEHIVERHGVLPMRFSDPSGQVRELTLVEKRRESDDVVSFYFASRDGGDLAAFEAGQHLPVTLSIPGLRTPISRSYSLSNSPGQGQYRISVKREPRGLASNYLHDHLSVGDTLLAAPPAGDFLLPPGDDPIVLISAGIGVTPMLSFLHELTQSTTTRPIVFVHSVRDARHHPMADEVLRLAQAHANVTTYITYTQPGDSDMTRANDEGRLDMERIRSLLPEGTPDVFLCGPMEFLHAMTDALGALNVPETRVHTEEF